MRYYEEDDYRKERKTGLIAVVICYVLLAIIIFFMKFSMSAIQPVLPQEGIMIDLGDNTNGFGSGMNQVDDIESQTKSTPVQEQKMEEPVVDDPEAVLPVKKKEKPKEKPKQKPKENIQPEKPKEQSVNKKALFPGTGTDKSKGDSPDEKGRKGDKDGVVGGGSGGGNNGAGSGFTLSGRSLREALPQPSYNVKEEGRVVVEVRVNQKGEVESAEFKPVGSTTQNNSLISSAKEAAKKAKFNVDENASVTQIGTITYIFKYK